MRVSTAFNRVLGLPGASVIDVRFDRRGRDRHGPAAAPAAGSARDAGRLCRATHDTQLCRWRHLDLGAQRCYIVCEVRRVKCPDCGVRMDAVPWARSAAVHARLRGRGRVPGAADGQDADRRADADRLGDRRADRAACRRRAPGPAPAGGPASDRRRRGQSYRRRHRYLTVVADHEHGRIVWCSQGPQRRHLAGVLRRARRAAGNDPGGLDRHVAAAMRRRSAQALPARRDLLRPVPRRPRRRRRHRPGPPRRVERPRPLARRRAGTLGQEHALVPAEGAGPPEPAISSARSARSSSATSASTAPSCSTTSCGCSTTLEDPALAPAHLDAWLGLGVTLEARAVRQGSPARSAPTATGSSPRSASASPTDASKASTATSG